jgi:hypothetical protein
MGELDYFRLQLTALKIQNPQAAEKWRDAGNRKNPGRSVMLR